MKSLYSNCYWARTPAFVVWSVKHAGLVKHVSSLSQLCFSIIAVGDWGLHMRKRSIILAVTCWFWIFILTEFPLILIDNLWYCWRIRTNILCYPSNFLKYRRMYIRLNQVCDFTENYVKYMYVSLPFSVLENKIHFWFTDSLILLFFYVSL